MPAELRLVLVFLSDLSSVVLMVCAVIFAQEARAVRNGRAVRRFADFAVSLAVAFSWVTLVTFDRRYNIFPWADLAQVSAEWIWVFRALVIIAFVRLAAALRQPT